MRAIILGAGGRGRVYTRLCKQYGVDLIAVADPDVKKLKKLGKDFGVSEERLFESWQDALDKAADADALINATPDRMHYETTMAALENDLHVLLEKPMSPSEEECITMVETAEKKGLILMICHVLRYAPFFEMLKKVIDSGRIGDIINLEWTENVSYWHFAHSYVRGAFRNEETSSPFILAKSCHDLDLFSYITEKKCLSVISEGGLTHFTEANKPVGAPKYCLDGCPHEKTCPHFAPALYLKQITNVYWPSETISADTSFAARYKALERGPFGRCVYQCDNNVADHQTAVFTMEGGMTIDFNMIGFSSENTRTFRIFGTTGDIRGHLDKGELEITQFLNMEKETLKVNEEEIKSSHGGGDARLVKDFINAVEGDTAQMRTTARLSLQSHLMAFAAEKSRKEGKRVYI